MATSNVPVNGNEELELFDQKPLKINGFTLRGRKAIPEGKPSITQWSAALRFAGASYESSPYWIGHLMAYAETRAEWAEKLDQAMSVTGLSRKTLLNLASTVRNLDENALEIAPSLSHAAEVMSLEGPEQVEFMDKARTEGWTIPELRAEIRASKRRRVLAGQAKLEGMFRIIYADPPWAYGSSGATKDGSLGKAERHYECMTMEQIAGLPVGAHAMPNSALFLWVTAPMLFENPGPRDIIEAWGFDYKAHFVWDKVLGMPGSYNHVTHELLLVATRGSCLPDIPLPQPKSVITIRRSSEHSAKPREFRQLIEKHWPAGPYLELFGRERVEGWTVFGDDANLWGDEATHVD